MSALNIVLAVLLFVSAIFLIVAVLMQSGKSKGVGAISGGSSETYFGKNKGKSKDKKLALLTTIVAIVFVVLAILAFVLQEVPPEASTGSNGSSSVSSSKVDTVDSSSAASSEVESTTDSSAASSK